MRMRVDPTWPTVIGEHTDQLRITSRRSSKSTISPIIDLGRNSMFPHLFSFIWVIFINIALPRFQKAIKKVRAVQRMRRNRGFAFSQTENAGRQRSEEHTSELQ